MHEAKCSFRKFFLATFFSNGQRGHLATPQKWAKTAFWRTFRHILGYNDPNKVVVSSFDVYCQV